MERLRGRKGALAARLLMLYLPCLLCSALPCYLPLPTPPYYPLPGKRAAAANRTLRLTGQTPLPRAACALDTRTPSKAIFRRRASSSTDWLPSCKQLVVNLAPAPSPPPLPLCSSSPTNASWPASPCAVAPPARIPHSPSHDCRRSMAKYIR